MIKIDYLIINYLRFGQRFGAKQFPDILIERQVSEGENVVDIDSISIVL